jgi:hypothetical protein
MMLAVVSGVQGSLVLKGAAMLLAVTVYYLLNRLSNRGPSHDLTTAARNLEQKLLCALLAAGLVWCWVGMLEFYCNRMANGPGLTGFLKDLYELFFEGGYYAV